MISCYRLGDLVLLDNLNENEKNEILNEHPESIGSQYILEKNNNNGKNNIDIITNIVLKNIEKNIDILPQNINDSTVVHLRLGDVVGGNEFHEKLKRPLSILELKNKIPNNKIYVIGKCFFAKQSSTNYEECKNLSDEYLSSVLKNLNAEYFDGKNADIDLCCAIKAKYFVQGRGYFSNLIVKIRDKLNLESIKTDVEFKSRNIVGYFHICQIDGWQKSFDLIFPKIKSSGLYDATIEINVGIVNNVGYIIDDERLHDPKIKLIFCNPAEEYERPTLYYMRIHADVYQGDYCYWYVHSKGLRHWNTPSEPFIIDWINFMLYWNIEKWKLAIKILEKYDTYGCNAIGKIHYSGNFWWTNGNHLKDLPVHIGDYYTAPEDYICKKNDKMFNIYSSGLEGYGHYISNLPENNYKIPDDFDMDAYYNLNPNLQWIGYENLVDHYLKYGKYENRQYKY
jgi:hypothetical protein